MDVKILNISEGKSERFPNKLPLMDQVRFYSNCSSNLNEISRRSMNDYLSLILK